jgi:hypothetical protein
MTIQRQNPWFENITLPARTKPTRLDLAATQAMDAAPKPTIDTTNATHVSRGISPLNTRDEEQFVGATHR